MIKFRSVLDRYESSELNQCDAAALLGITERTFRRWCDRYEEAGEVGLLDRRLGKVSGKRVPVDREQEVKTLYRTRYSGFTARHFHEHLVRDHQFRWGYSWTRAFLQSKGLLEKAPRRGAHRRERPRRPLPGMMLHQDGSRHEWLAGRETMDLIVTMDDKPDKLISYRHSRGEPVRIAAIAWKGADERTNVLQGLDSVSLRHTVRQMATAGFNTIRIPFSGRIFSEYPADDAIDELRNPDLVGQTALQVLDNVIHAAGAAGWRVILDRHDTESIPVEAVQANWVALALRGMPILRR